MAKKKKKKKDEEMMMKEKEMMMAGKMKGQLSAMRAKALKMMGGKK